MLEVKIPGHVCYIMLPSIENSGIAIVTREMIKHVICTFLPAPNIRNLSYTLDLFLMGFSPLRKTCVCCNIPSGTRRSVKYLTRYLCLPSTLCNGTELLYK